MEYLHKRAPAKLLHRDLKSSNVLLYSTATQPEEQTLKILDFGLAQARQEEQRSLSQEQFSAAGTYAWMAPERAWQGGSVARGCRHHHCRLGHASPRRQGNGRHCRGRAWRVGGSD